MIERGRAVAGRMLGTHWTAAAAIFALLAIVHTWPLAREPGVFCRNDNGDAQLNEWIVAWVAHQLPRDPRRLFQANIFYPAKDALAFSEPLIVPGLMVAPALWLGASPVLAINLLILIGFALTGLTAYALIYLWTRDRLAALAAGSLFAFNAHSLTRLAHVQALHAYGLPLALLLADRLIEAPRPRRAVALGACMAMTAYTSGYFAVFAILTVAVVVIAGAGRWRRDPVRFLAMLATAGVTAAALSIPVLLPYRRVAVEQQMVRSLAEVPSYSASAGAYLASPSRVHYATWSARAFETPVEPFFPGVIAIGLVLVALRAAVRGQNRGRAVMLIGLGALGFILSLGTKTPVYGWLYEVFPPMQGVRAATRFGILFLLAVALLAGLGLAGLRTARQRGSAFAILAAAVIVLVNVEALRAPIGYPRWIGVPEIYKVLAHEPGPVVLAEMPFYPASAVFRNAEYVLNSTAHWRPLLNGYSGYTPRHYVEFAELVSRFPREPAFAPMAAAGVTHIMVHPDRFGSGGPEVLEALDGRKDFTLIGVDEKTHIRLYRYWPEPLPPRDDGRPRQ